jgi:hypothetical protein
LPLLLQEVGFLEAGPDLSLILFVMSSYLTLSLLVNLDLKSALARPLLPEVFIEFIYTLVSEVFAFFLNFLGILGLGLKEPVNTSVSC